MSLTVYRAPPKTVTVYRPSLGTAPVLAPIQQSGPWRAHSVTFTGTNLTGCTAFTINGVAQAVTASTATSVTITTVTASANGADLICIATTPSGASLGVALYTIMWDPIDSSASLWLRGDSYNGTTHTWTDLSGNGVNVPLASGSPTPATTTLGGQTAVDLTGGAWFKNTLTSLVASGVARTILLIGQGTTGGGAFLAFRLATTPCDVQLYEFGGQTVALGDETAVNVFIVDAASLYVGAGFSSAHVLGGSPAVPTIYINDIVQSINAGHQTAESGTTGFMVGNNPGAQPWNGVIAELIVLPSATLGGFYG